MSALALTFHHNLILESSPVTVEFDKDAKSPRLKYTVKLTRNGHVIYDDTYTMGIGHLDLKKGVGFIGSIVTPVTHEEACMFYRWQEKPQAVFIDKKVWASLIVKMVKFQKLVPKLEDVLHSLLSDADADLDAMSFEDWCSNFGMDTDSRKAESTYKKCLEIGQAFRRAFKAGEIEELREWAREQ